MTGPLGETAGKNGSPELPAVKPLTLADLQAELMRISDGRACSINLGFTRGHWVACAEYAGGGFDRGAEATGTGADAETAVRAAIYRLPEVRGHA